MPFTELPRETVRIVPNSMLIRPSEHPKGLFLAYILSSLPKATFQTVSEVIFSETHMQPVASLFVRTGAQPIYPLSPALPRSYRGTGPGPGGLAIA